MTAMTEEQKMYWIEKSYNAFGVMRLNQKEIVYSTHGANATFYTNAAGTESASFGTNVSRRVDEVAYSDFITTKIGATMHAELVASSYKPTVTAVEKYLKALGMKDEAASMMVEVPVSPKINVVDTATGKSTRPLAMGDSMVVIDAVRRVLE